MLPTAVVCAVPASVALAAEPLDQYAWRFRPLVIVAPSEGSAELARQNAYLDGEAGELAERDIVVIEIVGDRVRAFGPAAAASASAYRRMLGIGRDEFAVVLAGKDTGVKFKSGEPVAMSRIYAVIDAMPMRQREMRQ